jgi:hypothetical protein
MIRQAPKTGYNFGNKRQYRRTVWADASRFLRSRRNSAQVLLMPSIEGDEIDVAQSKGFRQQNMHVVDKNPAIVAHLKRRYPLINTYGRDIVAALKLMGDRGVLLDFVNLDLCSTIESIKPKLYEIGSMFTPFSLHHKIYITIQRGREKNLDSMIDQTRENWLPEHRSEWRLTEADCARYDMLTDCMYGLHCDGMVSNGPRTYQSAHVTMMYVGLERWMEFLEK